MFRQFASMAALVTLAHSPALAGQPLTTVQVATGLSSGAGDGPMMVKSPPGDFSRVFVVLRGGRVMLIKNGVLQATPFIDLSSDVQSSDAERGMLDIAFHPNYASNGYFYLRYTNGPDPGPPWGSTVVRRYTRSANPDIASPSSVYNILRLASTQGYHTGGSIDFGRDGMLYVNVGDGAIDNNAQDLSHVYGKILRIDVNSDAFPADADNNYSIPAGNPYAGATPGADEIWANGVRNPFRSSFDRITGGWFLGDPGVNQREEISHIPLGQAGKNLGWPCLEGTYCWPNNLQCSCSNPALLGPIFEYFREGSSHCAITGGRVYRGCAIPDLYGTYFFADYCSATIWSFRYDNSVLTELNANRAVELDTPAYTINQIVGFGEDARGELYICDLGGQVYKIVPVATPPDVNGNGVPDSCEFRPGDVNHDGSVNVTDLLDVIGRWGPCFECPADIAPSPTGDGTVNVTDLLLVIGDWG